ncbi:GNAT family N-acetyltransferase [Bacillus suaedaesalsae]|uniref:GNAT family N-acetyltransferase n=1 Tax=Bacillus suaedaesalsae TaxID=2810349 RepID=A0ABS2DF71_9BACI|nr:GNAT family protein [Bacillus suaedaesalsae]MBM6617124.1 GNAT family N-acetyltransferase [Bacillus suaedaesalsae]
MKNFDDNIETARLIVRPYEKNDYNNWLTMFNNRLPSQHQYDDGKIDMSICTREWFDQLIQKHQQMALEDHIYVFGIFRRSDGSNLGSIDFSTIMRDEYQWARFGYTIHNQFWRKGYGSEAVKAAIHLAFTSLHYNRIEAHINLDNEASIKLAERVGLVFECVRKGFIFENDMWTDHLVYAINKQEFMNK